jgi:hypothetical protein
MMFDIRGFIAIGILAGLFMLIVGFGSGIHGDSVWLGGTILIGASMISIAILNINQADKQ